MWSVLFCNVKKQPYKVIYLLVIKDEKTGGNEKDSEVQVHYDHEGILEGQSDPGFQGAMDIVIDKNSGEKRKFLNDFGEDSNSKRTTKKNDVGESQLLHDSKKRKNAAEFEITSPENSPHKPRAVFENLEGSPETTDGGNLPLQELTPSKMSNVQKAIFFGGVVNTGCWLEIEQSLTICYECS